jgi:hypothetical protein
MAEQGEARRAVAIQSAKVRVGGVAELFTERDD